MKKTLFLGVMFGTALCSSAAGTIADYTTSEGGITYSGAIVEYTGNSSSLNVSDQAFSATVTREERPSVTYTGSQSPAATLGGNADLFWKYLCAAVNDSVYGQTLKMSGSTGSEVKLNVNNYNNPALGGLITTITSTETDAQNGSYKINGGDRDFSFAGNETSGVNLSIGANTTVELDSNHTITTATSGTWNIATGKTLLLDGGRILVKADQAVTLQGGGTVKLNITYSEHKLELESAAKFNVTDGTTLELNHDTTNYAFGTNAGIISSDNKGIVKLTGTNTVEHDVTNWVDSFTGHVVLSGITLQVATQSTRYASAASLTLADGGMLKGWGGNFNRNLTLNGGGIGDAGADETFSGTISLQGDNSFVKVGNRSDGQGVSVVTISGSIEGSALTKKGDGKLIISGEAKSFGKLKAEDRGQTDINTALTLSESLESGSATVNVNKNVTAGTFASTGNGGRINIAGGATLSISDSSSGQGLWVDLNSSVTIASGSILSIENGTLTLTKATGSTSDATVTRISTTINAAKLGVNGHHDYLKNVAVSNANVSYTGSGTLYLGSMQGGSLNSTGNIEFAGTNSSIGSLTLSGNSITLGTADSHDYVLTITSTLTVTGTDSTVNADLIMANGSTLDFSSGATLTMGCDVTIGDGVTVYITGDVADIRYGHEVTIINGLTSLDKVDLGSANIYVNGVYQSDLSLKRSADGTSIVVAPEPATATLSLLALAGLMARRRRH